MRDLLLYKAGAPFQAAAEFSYASPYAPVGPEVEAFARTAFTAGRPFVAAAVDLMHHIHEEFAFKSIGDVGRRRRLPRSSRRNAACARISRTCRLRHCARSACRRAT